MTAPNSSIIEDAIMARRRLAKAAAEAWRVTRHAPAAASTDAGNEAGDAPLSSSAPLMEALLAQDMKAAMDPDKTSPCMATRHHSKGSAVHSRLRHISRLQESGSGSSSRKRRSRSSSSTAAGGGGGGAAAAAAGGGGESPAERPSPSPQGAIITLT